MPPKIRNKEDYYLIKFIMPVWIIRTWLYSSSQKPANVVKLGWQHTIYCVSAVWWRKNWFPRPLELVDLGSNFTAINKICNSRVFQIWSQNYCEVQLWLWGYSRIVLMCISDVSVKQAWPENLIPKDWRMGHCSHTKYVSLVHDTFWEMLKWRKLQSLLFFAKRSFDTYMYVTKLEGKR